MTSESIRNYGVHILDLPPSVRERLLDLEQERALAGCDEEQFMIERFRRARIKSLVPPKKSNAVDGGLDFAVQVRSRVLIGQLKWWNRPLSPKQVREIFGGLYFSDVSMRAMEAGAQIRYLLVAPLLSKQARDNCELYAKHGYDLVFGSRFTQFMSNPYYFLSNYEEAVS